MPRLPTAFSVLFLAYFAGILLREASRKSLSTDEKAALGDSLSGIRKYGFLPAVAIILLTYNRPLPWLICSFASFLVVMQILQFWMIRRVIPGGRFLNSCRAALCLAILGVVAFVLIALYPPGGVA
jgi:hypothetical protein